MAGIQTKRKFIRETREFWYRACAESFSQNIYVLGAPSERNQITLDQLTYSFAREEYRFHGDVWTKEYDDGLWVGWDGQQERYSYRHVATSLSGIHMVQTDSWGGGSGEFRAILLFAFDHDRALELDRSGALSSRERVLRKVLGSIRLGDRYVGEITSCNGILSIGPDVGWFARGEDAAKTIPIR
jgi:hypothetical protein